MGAGERDSETCSSLRTSAATASHGLSLQSDPEVGERDTSGEDKSLFATYRSTLVHNDSHSAVSFVFSQSNPSYGFCSNKSLRYFTGRTLIVHSVPPLREGVTFEAI